MRWKLAALFFLSLVLPGTVCSPDVLGPTPMSDQCGAGEPDGRLDALEVRVLGKPTAVDDGDALPFTLGGQGTNMIGLALWTDGEYVPNCLAQQTSLLGPDGGLLVIASTPLRTYPEDAGGRVSGEFWLLLDSLAAPGTEATLRTEAYGQVFERRVWLDHVAE